MQDIDAASSDSPESRRYLPLAAAREAVTRAAASDEWQLRGFAERAECLRTSATLLRQRAQSYAEQMARELGKPVAEGVAEIEKSAKVAEFYAENGRRLLKPQLIETDASSSYVCFEPLGVVFAIMPWCFPFWQVFRCVAPALAAGNSVVLKHASLAGGAASAIADVFRDAGVPETGFVHLALQRHDAEMLIEHEDIAGVAFTGSTLVGRRVAAAAGRALKRTVLELGGSDPYLVLEDADLELAAEACVRSRLLNNGQSCTSAKRLIAVKQVRGRFQEAVVRRMQERRVGDPLEPTTDQGPMASLALRDALHAQVQASVAAGATLMLGGAVPPREGAWYPPTLLSNVRPGMPAYEEELLGPVAVIIEAEDEEAAIAAANDTSYGLGAAVFSRDRSRAERIAKHRLRAGTCFVNDWIQSDPRLPFGGVRASGYGRELSLFGIQEFVNVKAVYVK